MSRHDNVTLNSNGGSWQARWIDAAGQRHRKNLGGKATITRRAALGLCRDLERQLMTQPGLFRNGKAPTLRKWCDYYLELRTDLSDDTVTLYNQTIDYLVGHFTADKGIDTVTRLDAERYAAQLPEAGRQKKQEQYPDNEDIDVMAPATVSKHLRMAKCIFHRAYQLDLIPYNPFDRVKTTAPTIDHDWYYVTLDDLRKILEQCPNHSWRALIALCRLAGLRRGEAQRLRWTDIDWNARTVTVRTARGHETTKQRRRTVPIQPMLHDVLLTAYEAAPDGAERVYDTSSNNMTRLMQLIVKAAGIELYDKLFHTLRKNCETDWTAQYPVMDVCKWLGHHPTVAYKHYHKTKPETIAAVTGTQPTSEEQLRQQVEQLQAELAALKRHKTSH